MENSNIEWTDHTFNPWWGCMKVSEGCKNCYAETLDNRWNKDDPHWGPNSPRKPMSAAYWAQPAKWNNAAALAGKNEKVFCASMADVFESDETLTHYESRLMVRDARLDLLLAIATTPNLTWLLLTKRPDNIIDVLEWSQETIFAHDVLDEGNKDFLVKYRPAYDMLNNWLNGTPPDNVWIGTSVEHQRAADERIPHLLNVSAKVRFLSCEPLLDGVDLDKHLGVGGINWVICGGESGHGARPIHPDWARSLRDQCQTAAVPFFFKQWGEYLPLSQWQGENINQVAGFTVLKHKRLFASGSELDVQFYRTGKKLSGSKLDGQEWKEFPNG